MGCVFTITVDTVLRARGEMLRNKANELPNRLVTEVHEVTPWFNKRFKGDCCVTEEWKILHRVFLKKPNAKLGKALRGFRAVALL